MRGHFSIEWMAQSSQSTASGPTAYGTHSESLPGYYCRQRAERGPEQEEENLRPDQDSGEMDSKKHHNNRESSFSSSGTEEETSGYESEGGGSLSPTETHHVSSALPGSTATGRRARTAFTAEQIGSLEGAFKRNAYLGTQDKMELCKKLRLSDKQIRNWFQNRRMKLKRTVQDALAHACQANMASQFLQYSEMQPYRQGPYPRYHTAASASAAAAAAAAAAAQEPPPSYVHPHSLQYSARLPSVPTLALDSYQYCSLPPGGIMLPPPTTQTMGSSATYPHYY